MKIYILIVLAMVPHAVIAECDPDITGAWQLDYEHYLDVASKGKPCTRSRLDKQWGGTSFLKVRFDRESGRGTQTQRSASEWFDSDFTYQVTVDRSGDCSMTLSFDDGSQAPHFETYRFWARETGFCWQSNGGAWEDCFTPSEE